MARLSERGETYHLDSLYIKINLFIKRNSTPVVSNLSISSIDQTIQSIDTLSIILAIKRKKRKKLKSLHLLVRTQILHISKLILRRLQNQYITTIATFRMF